VTRLVDRGAITAAYVGIGMAATIAVSFLLVIPIEPFYWLLALPAGLLIGYYANQARQARELDPLSPIVNAIYAGLLTAAGQTEAAQTQVRRALELKSGFWVALQVRAGLAMQRGDTAAAMADLASAIDGSDRASQILALQAIAHAAAGDRILPQEVLQELEARRTQRYVPATSFAAAHAALGNTDAALDELERAYRERDIRMAFMKVDARWNVLRVQPRFRALAQHMGLVSDRGCSRL